MLAAVFACNTALLATVIALAGMSPLDLRSAIVTWSFFPVCGLAIATRERQVVIACLVWLIALYPLSVIWTGPS